VFPLTLTLSLGERERRLRCLDQSGALDSSIHGMCFSLSSRERAGVRGKRTVVYPEISVINQWKRLATHRRSRKMPELCFEP
jgi:hypothetical protein